MRRRPPPGRPIRKERDKIIVAECLGLDRNQQRELFHLFSKIEGVAARLNRRAPDIKIEIELPTIKAMRR